MASSKSKAADAAGSKMTLTDARGNVAARTGALVAAWLRDYGDPVRVQPDRVTLFEDFGLRKTAGNIVELYGPNGRGGTMRHHSLRINQFADWVMAAAAMKARLIVLAELSRLTGRTDLTIRHLRGIDTCCRHASYQLLGHHSGWWMRARQVAEQMTGFLDPEAWRLARRAQETQTTLLTYNIIAADTATWKLLEKQSPGLLPLISDACRHEQITFDANAFRSLKETLIRQGLKEAGWKTLCKMPIGHVRWMLKHLTVAQRIQVAAHYAEVDTIPPYEIMVASINRYARWYHERPLFTTPAWFDAAAARECRRQKKAHDVKPSTFVRGEYHDACDWLRQYTAAGNVPDTHQKKSGWAWVKRQSDAWHEEQVRQRTRTHYTWTSLLDAYEDDGYEVVPLTSSMDLAMEGQKMHHCVGSYAPYCHQGRSRIFSIRKNGTRLATAELVNYGSAWQLNQNRGPCNSTPSPEVMDVARRLQVRYNETLRRLQAGQKRA